ncbi:hypothetical protein HU200_039781 [Digitaria exilis]|uniref:CRC domain-containing protein n=1 Tax=Digitaria exilis TaxID=1010633 RepID=A0A835BA99_9POAL|nr:hypothetical protein HU200_039781 [Digitaria exilis]
MQDSPVFNFINNLSPIPPPKPSDRAHNVQLFKSSDLAPVSSIFASPHVNLAKEPKILIRDESVQLPQELHSPSSVRTRATSSITFRMIRCKDIVSENCNTTTCRLNEASIDSSDHTSSSENQLPQSIQNGAGSVEGDRDQCADGKTNISQECTDLEGMNLDESVPDKMDQSHSVVDLHENQLSEQNKDEPAAYNGDHMITNQPSSNMLKLGLPFGTETQSLNDTQKADNSYSGKPLLNAESSGYYIQNSGHEPHLYWTCAVEGAAVACTPQALPGALQSQLMPCNKLNEPKDYMPAEQNASSQHLRGTRRRSLFNEKAGAGNKVVDKASVRHSVNSTTPKCKTISGDINSKPLRTPPCALPGIGLHLNALAAIPKEKIVSRDIQSTISESSNLPCPAGSSPPPSEQNVINDDFAQTTDIVSAEPSSQGSPKKKRHKFDNGDGTSCKRCSCKKSKCLKLYCECFAAGVYCSEPCTCQGCLNNESNMDTVLSTRQQIESRNPLAFAPKVIHTSEPGLELGDFNNKTPASARHKRGCNCKKSSCLKKYCECFQGGVGCSISCRCESCKNAFGRREGVAPSSIEEPKHASEENNACVKEEKCEIDKQLVIYQATDLAPAENLLSTPLMMECRPLASLPPPSSKKPRSSMKLTGNPSRLANSQAPLKTDILLAQFGNYTEMFLGDSTSDSLKGNSSPQTSVKVVSPNKKRVSPPRMGTGLSPICKSGRKLILKSIPSFPSLGGDLNNEDPKSSPAP